MKNILVLLFVSFTFMACPQKKLAPNPEKEAMSNTVFTSLYSGNLNGSGEIEAQNIVVSTKEDWQKLLSKFELTEDSVPAIDFSKNTLLVLVDEVRNTGGFSIKVDKIEEKNDKLFVSVKKEGPKPNAMVTMSITQPFEVVKIDKADKEVVFE